MREDINFKDVTKDIVTKLMIILEKQKQFYIVAIIYSVGVSLLTLAVPLSVQALVNTITFVMLPGPLLILSLVLFGILIISGFLKGLQAYVIELFQRHFYAMTSSDIAVQLLHACEDGLRRMNSTELVNRFFDIMTVQKSMAKILTDTMAFILQTFVGLILLAFYHPYFLAFDILLIFLLYLVWAPFGRKALYLAVMESKAKYKTAAWLEDASRVQSLFGSLQRKEVAYKKTNNKIALFLDNRKKHFKVLFTQKILLLIIYALMSALILGLGGHLVSIGELSIGQLVAAEILITVILSGLAKSSSYLEAFYDLYAACDKIYAFYELKTLDPGKRPNIEFTQPQKGLELENLKFINKVNEEVIVSTEFDLGKSYLIESSSASLSWQLIDAITGVKLPKEGRIRFKGVSFSDVPLHYLKDYVYLIDHPQVFTGSLKYNLGLGMKESRVGYIRDVAESIIPKEVWSRLSNGVETEIYSNGSPMLSSDLIYVEIARAILLRPHVLVITEIFNQLAKQRKKHIINELKKHIPITLVINQDDTYVELFDHHYTLSKGGCHMLGDEK